MQVTDCTVKHKFINKTFAIYELKEIFLLSSKKHFST